MALMTRVAALALVILVLALCRGVEGEWDGRHAVSGEGRRPRRQGFGSPLPLLMPRTLKPVRARMPVLMLRGGSGSSMEMEENEGSETQQQDEQGGGDSISISASVDDDSKGTRVESISESELGDDDSDNKVADPGSDDAKHDYDAFFDSDGAFDAEGYIKFNKWPGYGQHLGGDRWRFVSTRMEIHDAGAEYGIFVDIEAKDRPIIVTGVKIAAHGLSNWEQAQTPTERETYMQDPLVEPSDPFALSVYMCEGSSRGKETDRSAWRLMATNESIQLPRINGKEDWDAEYRERWGGGMLEGEWHPGEPAEPVYGHIPWEHVRLEAGERRGFLIHGNCQDGVANRWPLHMVPPLGEVSDQDDNLRLYSSRAMPELIPFTEEVNELPFQQCEEGVKKGWVKEERAMYQMRREEGHCFVGEILYTVV